MANHTEIEPRSRALLYCTASQTPSSPWGSNVIVYNRNRHDIYLNTSSTPGSVFQWAPLANFRVPRSGVHTIAITPSGGPATETMRIISHDNINPPVTIDVELIRKEGVPRGALGITILPDPTGSDISSTSGEFIELTNISQLDLDLNYCYIRHTVFTGRLSPRPSGASVLRSVPILRPTETLRVYTRGRHSDPPGNGTRANPYRYFLNMPRPIWNNTGDTAIVTNQCGVDIATYSYPTTGPFVRTLAMSHIIYLNPRFWNLVPGALETSDLLVIGGPTNDPFSSSVTDGIAGSIEWFSHVWPLNPRRRLADGSEGAAVEIATSEFPLPGTNKYGVIGLLTNQTSASGVYLGPEETDDNSALTGMGLLFFVGSGIRLPIPPDVGNPTGPLRLYLAINDDKMDDNSGVFTARVDILRV